MIVTLNAILDGTEYTPRVGTEYEVSPGVRVSLAPPTITLQSEVFAAIDAAAGGSGTSDYDVARMVSRGEWPEEGECLPLVYARVVQDFFSLVEEIGRRLLGLSNGSPPSQESQEPEASLSQDG